MPNNIALLPLVRPRIPALIGLVDGLPTQTHQLETGLGGAPLEDGAFITDHAVAQPEKLTLSGYTSNLSDTIGARPTLAWQAIRRLQQNITPISVITPWHIYTEMIIIKAQASPDGLGQTFTLELAELLRVRSANASPVSTSGLFDRIDGLAGGLLGDLTSALGETGLGGGALIGSAFDAAGFDLNDITDRLAGPALGRTSETLRGRINTAGSAVQRFTSFF